MFSSSGEFTVNHEPAFSDSDHIVRANVVLHQVMLINALQNCHDTGDEAAQLCSGQQYGKGPRWLKSQSYRAAPASRCFLSTWGVPASLAHHSPAYVLHTLDAM